jgi:hypothetical protein
MTSHVQRLAAVAEVAISTFDGAIRGTGRTYDLVRVAEPGDQIVVASVNERLYLRRELERAGKTGVHILVHDPSAGRLDNIRPATDGRTYFESTWSYEFFRQQLDEVARSFYRFEQHLNRDVITQENVVEANTRQRQREALRYRYARFLDENDIDP